MSSHLLQMRGLKLSILSYIMLLEVASFTDAWIETCIAESERRLLIVASFTDAWIETYRDTYRHPARKSHLLQMRGLKRG